MHATTRLLVTLCSAAVALAACSRPDPHPAPPPPTPTQVDQDILTSAFHECFVGSCERSVAHIAGIAPDSPARTRDEFRAIHYRYDAERLLVADVEPDLEKRRAAYQVIAGAPEIDPSLRLAASERMARLGATTPGGAQEVALNASPDALRAANQEAEDLVKKSRSKAPADLDYVRNKLEPTIFSGKASRSDVGLLRTVCKKQHDDACVKRLDHLIVP